MKCSRKILGLMFMIIFFVLSAPPAKDSHAATIDELMVDLKSKDLQTQQSAIEGLGRMRDGKSVDELIRFVFTRAEDWKLKIKAILLLGEIDDPLIADRLVTVFNNPFINETCPAIRRNTALALGKEFNKGSRAVESLIDALDDSDILVREAAIQSLGKIGDSKAVPFLIPELDNRSFAIKFSAIKALENIGDARAKPFIKRIADTEHDPYLKEAALSALKNFRPY